jgi:AcrR family transcriptional regulator
MSASQILHGDAAAALDIGDEDRKAPGRRVAGQDPLKRQQIIEAAKTCFLREGFEATSMNDITAEAGVSKGTIYVYFEDKEALFTTLCREERGRLLDFAQQELDASTTLREGLTRFGIALTAKLTSQHVIRVQRMVLGVAEKMPRLAANFFGPEPFSGLVILKAYLERKVASGELEIDDTDLAARQFMDLAMAGLFKRRLFCIMSEEPDTATMAYMVGKAVDMFLCYYGPNQAAVPRPGENP